MMITWLQPLALLLLLLVPLLALFLLARDRARAAALRRIGDAELVAALLSQVSPNRRRVKSLLWLLTLVCLILALARPAWGVELQRVEKSGVAVMVVLDVSRSMDAQDIVPSRLERAIIDLRDLFSGLAGNDAGIILFAGVPVAYMPMTYDMDAAQIFLDAVSTGAINAQGTAIADALTLALDSLETGTDAQPIILLVSDGENHEGSTLEVARRAAAAGVVIHTLGYGTATGAVIPVYDAAGSLVDYKTDSAGNLVETRLDAEVLQRIADITGGLYQPFEGSGAAVQQVLAAVGAVPGGALADEFITRTVERSGLLVLLALLALALEMLLPETRRGVTS
ncbi:MAG: VWA domain-containing protein [Anaerolineae bacterium]|nr:VWA domain-containing protein [Anaerolineae bacterium]